MNTAWDTPVLAGWLMASFAMAVASVAATIRFGWPRRNSLYGVLAAVLLAASTLSLKDPLASMASYSAGLMILSQGVPPLLLLSVPNNIWNRWRGAPAPLAAPGLHGWLLDPGVAGMVFVIVSVGVSVPGIFEPALANALYSAPLGAVELLSGVLFWGQLFGTTRSIPHDWQAGLFALIGSMPMTAVAVAWMTSPDVLYMPYLNLVCRWDIPPLMDQHLAGFTMLLFGLPLQVTGSWLLVAAGVRRPIASA